jgi:pyruvate-formate lyase-activating enzyme
MQRKKSLKSKMAKYKVMTTIAQFVEQLPPDIQKEVKDFAEFLLEKKAKKRQRVPDFDWDGALKDEPYNSVQLQHEILRIRGN